MADDLPIFCDRCGCCTVEWLDCEYCCGDGETEPGELYDEDPLYYSQDDTEPCHWCHGLGGWNVCGGRCDEDGKHKPDPFSAASLSTVGKEPGS